MARRPPRQSRLAAGEAEEALAERWANYRVLPRTYLSATALASHATCNVKPFVERVVDALGIGAETPQMRAGALAHAHVQGAIAASAPPRRLRLRQALARRAFALALEYPLKDARRRWRGIADLVYARDGEAHVIELKNARPPARTDPVWSAPVWHEHGLQLAFYGLLARTQLGRTPRLALAYLKDLPQAELVSALERGGDVGRALDDLAAASVPLVLGPPQRAAVEDAARAFRAAERGFVLPQRRHRDPGICRGCRVRHWCPRRLDRPGAYEAIDARRLDAAH